MKHQLTCLAVTLSLFAASDALASSHREAPFVTKYPQSDGTDFYLFKSYEPGREDYVTMIANRPAFRERILESKLKRQIFDAVAIVVDMDLVQRLAVQGEVVRATVRRLHRDVIRDHRNVVLTARLVALEEIEVSAVRLRVLGDERSLAVAR